MRISSGVRSDGGILIGTGVGLAIVVLVLLQSIATSGVLSSSTETLAGKKSAASETTTTPMSIMIYNDSEAPIWMVFENYLINIQSGNYTGLMDGYQPSVTLLVRTHLASSEDQISVSDAEGASGNYTGSRDASILAMNWTASIFNQDHNMTITVLDSTDSGSADGTDNASMTTATNYTVGFAGFGLYGQANATIIMHMEYLRVGSLWLISDGTWTITNYMDHRVVAVG